MRINSKTKLCMIIGDPIEYSLSPQMHNAAYEALEIDDTFVFLAAQVQKQDIKAAVEAARTLGIRGLTCTIPHKISVMRHLDRIDETAKKIGAVNTVVNDAGVLIGYNTDWLGIVTPLEQMIALAGESVALIGAGGAGRASAFGLAQRGARVTIYNRTKERAQALAQEIGGEAKSLEEISEVHEADIIVNASSIGMAPAIYVSPVPKEYLRKNHIVFDVIYNPRETKLLREAKEAGARVISGLEMLLYQGSAQFEYYTGYKAPVEVMRQALSENA